MPLRDDIKLARLRGYCRDEAGVATVDWVLICCGATAMGVMALNMGQESLGDYSSGVRDEVQSPYFETSWTDTLDIPPEEYWEEQDPIEPDYEGQGGGTLADALNGDGQGDDTGPAGGGSTGGSGGGGSTGGGGSGGSGSGGQGGGGSTGGGGSGGSGGGGTVVTTRTPIDVQNNGFEATDHGDGSWSSGVPGWSVSAPGGADVGDFNPGGWSIDEATVTDDNLAFLYHRGGGETASMWQRFDSYYSADDTYEFTVDIGDAGYSFSQDQPYELNIYAGSDLIGTQSGTTGDIDRLEAVTVASNVSDPALNGQAIIFEIVHPSGGGGDLLVDNVQGTVISQSVTSQPRTIPASPVAGCPDPATYGGPVSTTTGNDLEDSDLLLDVTVGGSASSQLRNACSGIPGHGYFNANPTFTLELSDMDDMEELEIETNGTNCDTVLLIQDQQGNWHFDDDGGPGLESKIKFEEDDFDMSQFNGTMDVWVGTYGGDQCSFEMEIDTED